MPVTFSNVLLRKYNFTPIDGARVVTYKVANQEYPAHIGHVFIDARVRLDFSSGINAIIIACNYRLLMPVNFMEIVKDQIIERFVNFSDFKEDQEGWHYSTELDSFVESKINSAIFSKEIKAFTPALKMPENYTVTVDNIFSLAATKTLYKGRDIEHTIQ